MSTVFFSITSLRARLVKRQKLCYGNPMAIPGSFLPPPKKGGKRRKKKKQGKE